MERHSENIPLIRTKLQPPKLVGGLVRRPRLFERLNRGLENKLTLVSAPAGYGKTTLIASWLEEVPETTADRLNQ